MGRIQKNSFFIAIAFILTAVFTMSGCKPSVPSDIIQPGEMEDILYDYHLAQSIAQNNSSSSVIDTRVYKLTVLKKHAISESEFDSSMVYYMRHTERLQKIYESLADRFSKEAQEQGITVSQFGSSEGLMGDTTNIWTGTNAFVLNRYSPFNMEESSIQCDSSFHKGDAIILSFQSDFIFQDGSRNGIAVLAITYGNDSVAQAVAHLSSTQRYTLQLSDDNKKGIKAIKCLFLLSSDTQSGEEDNITTLRMMIISDISLIRMHRDLSKINAHKSSGDSIQQQNVNTSSPNGQPMSLNGGPAMTPPQQMQMNNGNITQGGRP